MTDTITDVVDAPEVEGDEQDEQLEVRFTEDTTVPMSELRPALDNVRLDELTDIEGLAQSILVQGLVQPITVNEYGTIIAGHRRYRAINHLISEGKIAPDKAYPVHVRSNGEASNRTSLMLVENLQRVNLDPVEEAKGYERLRRDYGFTQKQIAEQVGKSPSVVQRRMALLSLPEQALTALRKDLINVDQAEALVQLQKAADDTAVLMAVQSLWSVATIQMHTERAKHAKKASKLIKEFGKAGVVAVRAINELPQDVFPSGEHRAVVRYDKAVQGQTLTVDQIRDEWVDLPDAVQVITDYQGELRVHPIGFELRTEPGQAQQEDSEAAKLAREEKKRADAVKAARRAAIRDAVVTKPCSYEDAVRIFATGTLRFVPDPSDMAMADAFLGIPTIEQDNPMDTYATAIAKADKATATKLLVAIGLAIRETACANTLWPAEEADRKEYAEQLAVIGVDVDEDTLALVEAAPVEEAPVELTEEELAAHAELVDEELDATATTAMTEEEFLASLDQAVEDHLDNHDPGADEPF